MMIRGDKVGKSNLSHANLSDASLGHANLSDASADTLAEFATRQFLASKDSDWIR